MGKLTIPMAIFHSYVKLPEGNRLKLVVKLIDQKANRLVISDNLYWLYLYNLVISLLLEFHMLSVLGRQCHKVRFNLDCNGKKSMPHTYAWNMRRF